jgi:hypothetical protein
MRKPRGTIPIAGSTLAPMHQALGLAAVTLALVVVPGGAAKRVPLPGFVTPSGNIRCFYIPTPAHLLCTVRRGAYTQQAQDACIARDGLDWHGWEVSARRATTTVCSGGILWDPVHDVPTFRALAYGRTWHFAAFTCASRRTGLTCTTGTGHGVFLSRERWRGW